MMLDSRETFVDYTMPLGLHHLIGGDHYAPMPENPDPRRADWSAIYYHRADASGIGFDRTRARQQRRRPVPLAAARAVGRPARPARRTCCSGSTACRGTTGCSRAGRCGRSWSATTRRGAEEARGSMVRAGRRCAGKVDDERLRGRARQAAAAGRRRRRVARQVPALLPAVQPAATATSRRQPEAGTSRGHDDERQQKLSVRGEGRLRDGRHRHELLLPVDDPVPARFYTDTVGLSAVAVGTMFLVLRLCDAVFDPVIGALADRTHTRWGKFRPWILWTAVPFGVIFWPS